MEKLFPCLVPDRVLLSTQAIKVGADAVNGSFVVLPRHIDFVTAVVPSILYYQKANAELTYVAIDNGDRHTQSPRHFRHQIRRKLIRRRKADNKKNELFG